jgi:hypothetical protein
MRKYKWHMVTSIRKMHETLILWNEMQSMLCDNHIGVWLQWLTATPCMDMNIPENTLHEVSEQDILVTCFIHN